ncbi:OTU domain-containing protein 6B OS=Danio rerio GN=otud6b PE=2 SV=1 [Rhizoctonia solani AG-1 IB]|uniref:OTU domain-containing protein 6B n=1 Tax=Thanatephorus cucumeris (strain AG1-IB / isolate 7/3/14) TaxID=1108050 RepID=A0A0B7F2L5_THACB|nr:OTU domain-containing protein 6B OS=Danio rerio GN=otud6b PE=2 SV=1 [Rhizoctonia solani AG-1 IB]
MARKRDKIKKVFSPPPAEPTPVVAQDDGLEDDLFAQLDSRDAETRNEAAEVLQSVENAKADEAAEKSRKDSKSRFQARITRKMEQRAAELPAVDEASKAQMEREIKEEEEAIMEECKAQGIHMVEIPPDGHCLYTAVADQLALLGLIPSSAVHPSTTRNAAADYMLAHPDSFIPFLPSVEGEDGAGADSAGLLSPQQFQVYCARIRDTGTWGGEPEIMALANAYKVPIHVVQSGPQRVVVHQPQDGQVLKPDAAVKISYHRRMYGLGEHYNSLRPKTIVDRIPGMEQVRSAFKA